MALFTIAGDGVLSEAEFVKGCLEDADLVGFAFRIYSTGCVDSPNLGFPYFNFLGGYQLKKHPVSSISYL